MRPTILHALRAQPRLARCSSTATHAYIAGKRTTRIVVDIDGKQTTFQSSFLRDHCRCAECVHPKTKQRLAPIPSARHPARKLEVTKDGLAVTWAGGHESLYPWEFLAAAAYSPPLRERPVDKRTTWGRDVQAPSTTYEAIHEDESAVLDLLDKVHEYGFAFVHGLPATPEDTEATIKRIGPIRHTHYGGFWDFTADMSHGDLAYSSQALPAHTDTTYFSDPAGLQIFHLLSHPSPGKGGHTLLVDGFYAAEKLKASDPSAYKVLASMPIPAHASGTDGTRLRPLISRPVLQHDEHGGLAQVRWNNEDRGVLGQGWSTADVGRWYGAARKYAEIVKSKEAEYWVPLKPGTLLVIDNWRVMHGRSAFTGARRMCGAYVGADDWQSRRRWLAEGTSGKKDDLWSPGW